MTNDDADVVVIGGGPGGTSCAAALAHRGIRTLLLEKNPRVGGKPITVSRHGYRYELGPKLQVPMRGPAFATLFEKLGITARLRAIPLTAATLSYRPREESTYRTVVAPQTGDDPTPLFDLWGIDESERLQAFELLTQLVMLEGPALDALDDVTMHDHLRAQPQVPWRVYSYMAMHANASLAEPIDRVAASEQVRILQDIALRGAGGYYRGGFGRVLDDLTAAFRGMGGEVRCGHRVERIFVDGDRVTGVETQHGRIQARAVVSSAGIQPTVLKLVGADHFEPEYAERIRRLEPGWGWASVRYFLDAPVFQTGMAMLYSDESWWNLERARRVREGHDPDEVIVFLTVPAVFDPTMAPAGRQCIVAGTICSPDPAATEVERLYRRVDAMIERVYPEAWRAVVDRETDGPAEISAATRDAVLPGQGGECVGLGQIVGQCGRHKPRCDTPIRGLYLAGTDAGAAGMGTHQASTSGMLAADAVLAYLRADAEDRAAADAQIAHAH